jgi:hypothetical protein
MNAQLNNPKVEGRAEWFEKYYECSECNTTWTDEWSCMCNDRCPNCDCETQPSSAIDLSRPLAEDDYRGAARLLSNSPSGTTVEVTAEDAKAYAEAILEGGEHRFSPPRWERITG